MRRKLFLLGFASLGGITGISLLLKGDSNKELPELISEEETPIADLPEDDIKSPEVVEKERKTKLIQQLSLQASKLKWTNSSDTHEGIKIGNLKGFLVEKNPSKAQSIAGGNVRLLEQFLKELPNRENYPFFKKGTKIILYPELKAEIEKGDYPFIG